MAKFIEHTKLAWFMRDESGQFTNVSANLNKP